MRTGSLSLLALLMMAMLVACGGDDDGDDADPTATTAAAVATATMAAPEPTATAAAAQPTATVAAVAPATTTAAPAATATTAPAPTAPPASPTAEPLSGEVTIFAAASLTDVFEAAAEELAVLYPDLTLTFNFAGSQALVTQLSEGAPADVFASANNTQMTAAQDADVIASDPATFTRNRLAIVVPADNPAGIATPADLANEGAKLVLANPDVPVGAYSRDILAAMSADAEFGADFAARVEANVVSQESNVRDVVTKVQLGEADAGIVYVTDITADVADAVQIVEIPVAFNIIASYPIALVTDGDAALGQAFIDYILSDAGQALLAEFGFTELE